MKKLTIILVLLGFGLTMSAQGKFENFFGRVPSTIISKDRAPHSSWLPRPAFTVSTLQIPIGAEARLFNGIGTGFSLAHFKDGPNGEPYQDFAATLSVLVGTSQPIESGIKAPEPVTEITIAAGVTLWEYINFGGGYNFTIQKPVILLNLTYSFN